MIVYSLTNNYLMLFEEGRWSSPWINCGSVDISNNSKILSIDVLIPFDNRTENLCAMNRYPLWETTDVAVETRLDYVLFSYRGEVVFLLAPACR